MINLGKLAAILTFVGFPLLEVPFPPGPIVDFLEPGKTGKHVCERLRLPSPAVLLSEK